MRKKVSVWWPVITLIAGVLFGSGSGVIWEWQKARVESTRLDIEKAKVSLEIREKMTGLFGDILKYQTEDIAQKRFSEELRLRIDHFNAMEKTLAQLEGRKAVIYSFPTQRPASASGLEIK